MAKKNDWKYVFICEDDITFLEPETFMRNLTKFYEYDCDWDVLLVAGNNAPPYRKSTEFCIQVHNCQTATGYIVKNHYYDVLIQNFREGLANLMKNPDNKREYAVDMYWKRLQGRDRWYMIIPPTVIQYPGYSNIEKRNVNYEYLMKDLDKEWLFQYQREQMQRQRQMQQQQPTKSQKQQNTQQKVHQYDEKQNQSSWLKPNHQPQRHCQSHTKTP
jgi:GR25 family glycosyltransferase involved in LPS biosynthesis